MTQNFQQTQIQFANHLRAPDSNSAPKGIEERRLNVYRELFFNNVKGFVDQAFPVLRSLLDEEDWLEEVRSFWREHACESPYFVQISKSFLDYLAEERQPKADDFPFLLELAHYEWVELELSVRHHEQLESRILPEQVHSDLCVQLSDLAWPLQYQYPVHHISSDYLPQEPSPHGVFLVVYRNEQGEVNFLEVNAVTAKLLELIQAEPAIKVYQLIEYLVPLLPQYPQEQLELAVFAVLRQLIGRGIIRQPIKPYTQVT